MEARTVNGSLTRITDFDQSPPDVEPVPRDQWRRGDYVVVEMLPGDLNEYPVETPDGTVEVIIPGDRLIGALGTRAATLECTGTWEDVGPDLEMHSLTMAGVIGRRTSAAADAGPVANVGYLGHATRDGRHLNMADFVTATEPRELDAPAILIIGTSMSSGKTVSAVAMTRELVRMGKRVVGAKVTGVGRLRDILAMKNAGAEWIFDFVDVGFPSSVVPPEEYEQGLRLLLSKIAATEPDVVIIEAGASPLEPYNGDIAVKVLKDSVAAVVLCSFDPYAVVGVMNAFNLRPDLISGRCTSTLAGIELIGKLTGIPAINMLEESSAPEITAFLERILNRS